MEPNDFETNFNGENGFVGIVRAMEGYVNAPSQQKAIREWVNEQKKKNLPKSKYRNEDFANKMHVSLSTFKRKMRGETNFTYEELKRLTNWLGNEPADVIGFNFFSNESSNPIEEEAELYELHRQLDEVREKFFEFSFDRSRYNFICDNRDFIYRLDEKVHYLIQIFQLKTDYRIEILSELLEYIGDTVENLGIELAKGPEKELWDRAGTFIEGLKKLEETKTEADAEAEAETGTEAEAETKAETEMEAETETKAEAETEDNFQEEESDEDLMKRLREERIRRKRWEKIEEELLGKNWRLGITEEQGRRIQLLYDGLDLWTKGTVRDFELLRKYLALSCVIAYSANKGEYLFREVYDTILEAYTGAWSVNWLGTNRYDLVGLTTQVKIEIMQNNKKDALAWYEDLKRKAPGQKELWVEAENSLREKGWL